MTFVFPLLLGGLVLAGVPILLHLIVRQKPRTLPFPAFRFLVQKRRQTQRKLRLRHFLLLALRMLLLAAMCLALARPRLFSEGLSLSAERPVAAVLVFDTSASMDYRGGNTSRLDEAKARAVELLDRLPDGGRVLVLDSADAAEATWLPSPDAARHRIASLKVRPANAPLTRALEIAYRRLGDLARSRDDPQAARLGRLLAVFADRTRGGWAGDVPRLLDAADAVPPPYEGLIQARPRLGPLLDLLSAAGKDHNVQSLADAVTTLKDDLRTLTPQDLPPGDTLTAAIGQVRRLTRELLGQLKGDDDPLRSALRAVLRDLGGAQVLYFDVGVDQPIDLALVQLDLPRDSAGQPQQTFREGEPIRLQATVQAVGKDLSNALVWQVGDRKESLAFDLKAGESRTLPFVLDPEQTKLGSGPHSVTASFETAADALPFNNRRFVTFAVRERQKVLVLADDPKRAAPLAAGLEALGYVPTVRGPNAAGDPANYHAVYLVGVAAPSPELWKALQAYVAGGGGLAVVPPGDDLDAKAYTAGKAIMPGTLGPKRDAGEAGRAWDWNSAAKHPLMRPFRAWKDNPRVDFIRYPRTARYYWPVTPTDATALVAYEGKDQHPALLERTFDGGGRVLLFTTPLDAREPTWNNYADTLTSFYLALLMQSTRHLAGELAALTLNFTLGRDTPTVAVPAAPRFPQYQLVGPETLERVAVGSAATVAFKELTAPGNYVLEGFDPPKKTKQPLARFSLNLPPEESDLTRVPAADVERVLGPDCLVPVEHGADLSAVLQGHWSEPAELLPWLMMLILVALALENLLANRFYRQPASEITPTPVETREAAHV